MERTASIQCYAGAVYAVVVALYAGLGLASLPLGLGDTDVWYHLNSGRRIVQTGNLTSDSSFFSFLEPPRPWTNYYWLFQTLAYLVFSVLSFPGMIALPVVGYLGSLLLIYRFFNASSGPSSYGLTLFVLYALFLLPRFGLARPHVVTYVTIVAMLFILERGGPRSRFLLPVLAVLWVNFHGVAYPILLLIGFAYSAEVVVDRIRSGSGFERVDVGRLAPIALAMYAVYLTPHGFDLLRTPFAPIGAAMYYIAELRPLLLDDLLSFAFSTSIWSLTHPTVRNLLVALVGFAFIRSLLGRSLRVSHGVLAFGGLVLLFRGSRFMYEFLLLCLPLVASTPFRLFGMQRATRAAVALASAIAAVLPFTFLYAHFWNMPTYPVSQTHLPHGIVKFLRHVDVGGRVLNHPNNGGYLQWALGNRYKIAMDMEVPFFFTNEDFYVISQAYEDAEILRRLVSQYRPDFIAVPLWQRAGVAVMAAGAPEYVLVFVDDVESLYVDGVRHPDIADRFALKWIDPKTLPSAPPPEALSLVAMLPEADRILAIHPESGVANHIAGLIRLQQGQHEEALRHADRIVLNHPQAIQGYALRAEVLKSLGRLEEARTAYEAAIARSDLATKIALTKRLGVLLFEAGMYQQSARALRWATNVFGGETGYQDLYYLGAAMFETREVDQAAVILRFGLHKVPENDETWKERYMRYITILPQAN